MDFIILLRRYSTGEKMEKFKWFLVILSVICALSAVHTSLIDCPKILPIGFIITSYVSVWLVSRREMNGDNTQSI